MTTSQKNVTAWVIYSTAREAYVSPEGEFVTDVAQAGVVVSAIVLRSVALAPGDLVALRRKDFGRPRSPAYRYQPGNQTVH